MSKYNLDAKLVIIHFSPEFGRKISDLLLLCGAQWFAGAIGKLRGISFNKMWTNEREMEYICISDFANNEQEPET